MLCPLDYIRFLRNIVTFSRMLAGRLLDFVWWRHTSYRYIVLVALLNQAVSVKKQPIERLVERDYDTKLYIYGKQKIQKGEIQV